MGTNILGLHQGPNSSEPFPPGVGWITLLSPYTTEIKIPEGCTPVVRYIDIVNGAHFPDFVSVTEERAKQIAARIKTQIYDKGFRHIRFGNEPNNSIEMGSAVARPLDPVKYAQDESQLWINATMVSWVYRELAQLCPRMIFHIPAPSIGDYSEEWLRSARRWYEIIQSLNLTTPIGLEAILDIHPYWASQQESKAIQWVKEVASKYPRRRLYCAETGRGHDQPRSLSAGNEMKSFLDAVKSVPGLLGVSFWLWHTADPAWTADQLIGTNAWNLLLPPQQLLLPPQQTAPSPPPAEPAYMTAYLGPYKIRLSGKDLIISPRASSDSILVPDENYSSPNHGYPRGVGKRLVTKGVIIHSTRGRAQNLQLELQATRDWFLNPASEVSAHRLVGSNGHHIQMLDDDGIAWHAGNAGRNYNTEWLSIELVQPNPTDPFFQDQYEVAAKICLYWASKYNLTLSAATVKGHDQIDSRQSDPGILWDWIRFWHLIK